MLTKYYIFGYGSLLDTASRTRTTPTAVDAYPAVLSGYKRGWFTRRKAHGFHQQI